MSVFKEEIIALEELARNQVQIYPDACDIGVIATSSIKNILREVLRFLLPLEGNRVTWRQDLPNITQREYQLRVYWSPGEGTEANILYVNDRNRKKEFFTISLQPFLE